MQSAFLFFLAECSFEVFSSKYLYIRVQLLNEGDVLEEVAPDKYQGC
jgi:hypothetical protein